MSEQSNAELMSHREQQVETLMRDFFRLEVPHSLPPITSGESFPASSGQPMGGIKRAQTPARASGLRGVITATALGTLALAVLLLTGAEEHRPQQASTATNTSEQEVTEQPEKLILVSPKAGNDQPAVSENGLLLQETEQIDLNPQNKK